MNAFREIVVDFVVEGGTRVSWLLDRHFTDPLPHLFQLQVALTSAPTADDWEDVGTSVENSFFAVDDEKRVWGQTLEAHYRVVLTSPVASYTSQVTSAKQGLSWRDWLDARELYRQFKKKLRKYDGVDGFLLKRKRFGVPCGTCLHPVTHEATRSDCPECFGTAVTAGYYRAVADFFIDVTAATTREKTDMQSRATTKDTMITGNCPGDIMVNSRDLWVEKHSGQRWSVETVKIASEHRAYPIGLTLELRQIPFSEISYKVPLEGS